MYSYFRGINGLCTRFRPAQAQLVSSYSEPFHTRRLCKMDTHVGMEVKYRHICTVGLIA
jgi:hypothetical protein